MKTRAIRIHQTGGPEVLTFEEIPVDEPGAGEVLLRHTAIGLNFIDTYHRSGLYPLPQLPAVLGREAAGVIEAVGPDVDWLAVGDRVAYPMSAGSYCELRTIPAAQLVRLPDEVDERLAAAIMLKGLTAHYLLRRTFEVRDGQTVLIHAAAGGVGLIACQWAHHLGATVIGTVGSAQKAELAREHGCDHPILYKEQDFVEQVREITDGAGVQVVYDSVGQETFEDSLDCLAPLGMMVTFGQSSGPIPPFNLGTLAAKGSLFITRPTLATYIARRDDLVSASEELFELVIGETIKAEVRQTYALSEAQTAHRDLEARRTTGSTVLLP